jgi:hypothetical protein
LPVVLYGFEFWCFTLREEHELMVFVNRVLKRIFGPEMDEVTMEWRRLLSEELCDLSSPNFIRVMKYRRKRWARHVARLGTREVRGGFW